MQVLLDGQLLPQVLWRIDVIILLTLGNADYTVIFLCSPNYTLQECLKSPTFLQEKIQQYFLDNKHNLTLVMTPDVRTYVHV